jgi:hypothetical protein
MDHIGQIIAIVGACLTPIALAFATYVRALAKNLGDNNRGQNAALQRMEDGLRKGGVPVPPPPPAPMPRRAKRPSVFHPRAVTPLPFKPIQLDDKEDT